MSDTKNVKVVVYVDGEEVASASTDIEEWAVDYVVGAAIVQVEDPDYDGASDEIDASLPPG